MENSVLESIRRVISRAKFGTVFFVSSFPKYAVEYVTKLLARFCKEGLITRISKGVYVKVKKTRFGILYPSVDQLVIQIAKRDKAKVIPTGATAENQLGFSTQVPLSTNYLTTGSTRKLLIGNRTITLKHGAPKNFAYRGKLMPALVQALRSIGEKNITDEVERMVGLLLSEMPETDTIEHDLLLAPVWIRELIKRNRRSDL